MKSRPNRRVVAWIEATPEELLNLSVITIGEIRKGIDLLDDDEPRRAPLQSWLDRALRLRFARRLPTLDQDVRERCGQPAAAVTKPPHSIPTTDAQPAATAPTPAPTSTPR